MQYEVSEYVGDVLKTKVYDGTPDEIAELIQLESHKPGAVYDSGDARMRRRLKEVLDNKKITEYEQSKECGEIKITLVLQD